MASHDVGKMKHLCMHFVLCLSLAWQDTAPQGISITHDPSAVPLAPLGTCRHTNAHLDAHHSAPKPAPGRRAPRGLVSQFLLLITY